MPSVINTDALSLNPQEADNVSKYVFEKALVNPVLTNLHLLVTDIQHDEKIPLVGLLGLVGECISGCSIPSGSTVAMSEKVWSPKTMGFRLSHCSKDVNPLLSALKNKVRAYPDEYNAAGSQEEQLIMMVAEQATTEMVWRLTQFGDTAIDNVSGGGTLVNGTDTKYFSCIDGFWKQALAAAPSNNSNSNYVAIAENAEATYADQDNLDPSRAFTVLRAMYNQADARLLAADGLSFRITRSLATNLQDFWEDKNLAKSLMTAQEVTGTNVMKDRNSRLLGEYRGIPIYIVDSWDRNIRAYFKNGTKYNLPHRAVLTTNTNVPVGTPSTEMLGSLASFYYEYGKLNIVDAEAKLDVKVLENYMIQVAY